jgi:hypothetical protein
MCYFFAVKFGILAAEIRQQTALVICYKCIIPIATSPRSFRLGRGNLIPKFWRLRLNDNCDFWANILSQITDNLLIEIWSFGVEITINFRGGKISEAVAKTQSKIQNPKSKI